MQYRTDRYGNKLSVLGYGCMRFPRKLGVIDMAATEQQLLLAIEQGVNYLDTAYIYGGSEAALGQILEKNGLRDQVYIATKLPHYLIHSYESLDKLFTEQLQRLRTDHIDYYLMHMLTDPATWQRLVDIGMITWLEEKKRTGAIRQVGFSYHGGTQTFCRLLDAWDWDFCQIQYNYMDEHSQAGRRGLHYAHEKGIPVVIMEPLRGGRLVRNLPAKALHLFERYPVRRTPAQWALSWLWDQKEVTVVLSGMNSLEMVEENCQTASQTQPGQLQPEDHKLLGQVLEAINGKLKVGCTACGYCTPCPMGVDIPGIFAAYNRGAHDGKFEAMKAYAMCTTLRTNSAAASQCIGCGKCEKHCPQAIPIRQKLKEAQKELEGPIYRIFCAVAKKFTRF